MIAEQKPTSPDGRWHLRDVSCNGANRSTTKPFPVEIHSGESVVCTFVNSFVPRGSISIAKITEGGVGTASFVVTPATGPPTPHLQHATTTTPGVPAAAEPQTPADATGNLRLGPYHIVEQPPLSSTGDWALTSVVCNGVAIPFAQGTATIELTRKDPHVHCVFTNAFSAKPPVPPKPTPVPPNPTPVPPVPPNPQTPGGAYDIADLIVTKVASAPVVTRGQVIGFRITVKNRGPSPAQRVVVDDQPRAAATAGGGPHHCRQLPPEWATDHLPVGHAQAGRQRDHHRSLSRRDSRDELCQSRRRRNIHPGAVAREQRRLRPGNRCRPATAGGGLRQLRPRATRNCPHRLLRPATTSPVKGNASGVDGGGSGHLGRSLSLRQPPARLLAMIWPNIAANAGSLITSFSWIATVRAVLLSRPPVMMRAGSGTIAPS